MKKSRLLLAAVLSVAATSAALAGKAPAKPRQAPEPPAVAQLTSGRIRLELTRLANPSPLVTVARYATPEGRPALLTLTLCKPDGTTETPTIRASMVLEIRTVQNPCGTGFVEGTLLVKTPEDPRPSPKRFTAVVDDEGTVKGWVEGVQPLGPAGPDGRRPQLMMRASVAGRGEYNPDTKTGAITILLDGVLMKPNEPPK